LLHRQVFSVRPLLPLAVLCLLPALAVAQPKHESTQTEHSAWQASWPTFSWAEGAGTVAAGALTGVLWLREPPHQARWQGGILFDDVVRRGIRLSSESDRRRARSLGDLPYYAAPALPLLVDPLLVWLWRDDAKTALNLELIGLQAFAYAGLSSFISTRASLRQRPDSLHCWQEHPDGAGCQPVDTESFWSGHTTIAATSAGLTCAHHHYLALWGHAALDAGACALATSGALATGVSRLLADRHYATDVLVGMGVGFGVGYAVPVLLHYSRGPRELRVALQPVALGVGSELSFGGPF
jgi:membrane-associated phospholipid phosphatase